MTGFKLVFIALVFCGLALPIVANGQTAAFTYQGKLMDSATPANGFYDFTMVLWDAQTDGTAIGSPVIRLNTPVVDGIFTVQLDFGVAAFNGSPRYLEIRVKPSGNPAILPTLLSPRQLVTSTPYAIKSLGAVTADSLSINCVNCITSSQIQSVQGSQVTGNIAGSQITGAIPVSSVPAGSTSYIQNGTTQQASSDFNISGTGKADKIDVTTQYSIAGARILSNAGTNNLFAGVSAGAVTTGNQNTFFGASAGKSNTTGVGNSFFGSFAGQSSNGNFNAFFGNLAGQSNSTGHDNNFFGNSAGASNTTGSLNAFFGNLAGALNTTGSFNAFVGFQAGRSNTTGLYNAFFGYQTGTLNTSGKQNSFVGTFAGADNLTGDNNAFFGYQAGASNTTGSNNTFIGQNADFFAADPTGDNDTLLGANSYLNSGVSNGTAIGANASVTQSNSLILGSINGINGATADTKVGIGTTAPTATLDVIAKSANAADNTVRFSAPNIGPNASHIHFGATGDWYIRSAVSTGNVVMQDSGGNVGIGVAIPLDKLHVNGIIRLNTLGTIGSNSLCLNPLKQIASCSSSRRYKTNIVDYPSGLSLINRLRPVTFDWKGSGMHDIGLVAEEVAEVEPLLVTHNDKGEIEGVKYAQVSAVLVNAIKDQQAQIQTQQQTLARLQDQMRRQQQEIDLLKRWICRTDSQEALCQRVNSANR